MTRHAPRFVYLVIAVLLLGAAAVVALWRMSSDTQLRMLASCDGTASSTLCYSEHINAALKRDGLGKALEYTAYAYAHSPQFANNCHGEMHVLGADAYRLFSEGKEVALSNKAAICGYGLYHGFMEALLYATHDYAQARAFCAYAGEQVPNPPGYAEGACYHGIGHGVTDGEDSSLWGDADAMVKPGLAMCKNVAGSNPEWEFRCLSGLYNSMALMAANPKYKLDMQGDPYLFCKKSSLTSLERRACYEEMNTLVVAMSGRDIEKTLAYIDTIADAENRYVAFRYTLPVYGSSNAGSPELPSLVSRTCARYDGTWRTTCVGGFVSGMLETGVPGKEHEAVLQLCGSDTLASDMRAACYKQLLDVTQIAFSKDAIEYMCDVTPLAYRPLIHACVTI